jgi:hypothetical protein
MQICDHWLTYPARFFFSILYASIVSVDGPPFSNLFSSLILTVMLIRIQIFTLRRIWIQIFTLEADLDLLY